ncbi:tetratricopeptide repeat protein [Chitinivorax sp. PXF-14]|uniref:L,D-transpeptidase Cds6 family protein n=1 Tax=Chitinivorax sp. PXF-14 TaxID=3230488 RepID=UPI0034679C28
MKFRSLLTAALISLLPALPALGAEPQEISKLVKQGQYAQALERADKFLQGNPKDAQVRFQRGLVLAEMGRTQDAIKAFTELSQDYPELPEPYNNLAVLYASQNQLDKARQSLEMAIQTHPSYAVAHENLGDIYAKLASQAYDKALQLDKTNNAAQTKLSLIRELFSKVPASPVSKPAAPVALPATPAVPVAPAAQTSKPAPVVAVAPAKPAVVVPAPQPAKPADKPVEKPLEKVAEKPATAPVAEPKAQDNTEGEVLKTVDGWAKAWSDRKVSAYLGFYGKSFKTPGGESRDKWEDSRRDRISRAKRIDVGVESPRVKFDGDRVLVSFTQHYRSDALKSSTGKTLVLVRSGKSWQIVEERVGK